MSIIISIPGGTATIAQSKAVCPECQKKISFDEIEKKWARQDNPHIRIKCLCKRMIGITQNIKGDFVAYKLK